MREIERENERMKETQKSVSGALINPLGAVVKQRKEKQNQKPTRDRMETLKKGRPARQCWGAD